MKWQRLGPWLLLSAVLTASAGCRTAGVGDLTRKDVFPKRAGETAAALLVDHNRNAERVQSVEARPSISVAHRRMAAGVSGKLALERPRNFKLVLSGPMSEVANIGSNEREFWFWVKDSPEKAVFYCNYDEAGGSPLAAGFQPDWIVEALGLRVIPESEAAQIQVSPGRDPMTLLLTQRQKTPQGEAVVKETTLSESTRRILEHRVYSSDRKTLLAHAVVYEYQDYPVPAEDGGLPEKVYLPRKFRLEWGQEKMALDIAMSDVKVNVFDPSRREALFVEPVLAGIARINLGERAGVATAPTSVRETMPAPPPRVRLKEPAPIGIEGASRLPRDPATLGADLSGAPARRFEEVVGPTIPTGSDPEPIAVQARSGWRQAFSPAIER